MIYELKNGVMKRVKSVVVEKEGVAFRITNPTVENCIDAGIDAYEYESRERPEYNQETQYLTHAYDVKNGVITDIWTIQEVSDDPNS